MDELKNSAIVEEYKEGLVDFSAMEGKLKSYEDTHKETSIEVSNEALEESLLSPLPESRCDSILVSNLLSVSPEQLPGSDFLMPVFSANEVEDKLKPYHISQERENLKNYEPDVSVAYWVCLGFRDNLNHLLTGVKGCGKTSLIHWIASRLGWPVINVVGHSQLSADELYGQVKLSSDDDNNVTTSFEKGLFTLAMEYGAIFLFDEVFQTPSVVLSSGNSAFEIGGKLIVPSAYDGDRVISKHPNCRFVFTSNSRGGGDTTGKYVGEEVVNSATLDRIQMTTEVKYMPVSKRLDVLRNMLKSEGGDAFANETDLKTFVSLKTGVNDAFMSGQLSDSMSMRGLL